jgi:uncharacterized protein (TIGR02266 family)
VNKKSNGPRTGLEPIAKRVPIERKIDLRFPNFEGLITHMSANLSTSGMFIQTETPRTPGTEFDFGIRIEEWSPIQGVARVIWTRSRTESPERPAGMGVQFVELDGQSRRMIRWLVDKHTQEGGRPFDIDRVPAGASGHRHTQTSDRDVGSARPGQRQAGKSPASARGGNRSRRGLMAALVLVGLAVAALGVYRYWFDESQEQVRSQPVDITSPDSEREPGIGPEPDSGETTVPADKSTNSRASAEAVTAFLRSWSTSWEKRDPDAVKALYSERFDGATSGGRTAWEAGVDQRIRNSDYINIAISSLEVDFPTPEKATATFFRSWRSDVLDETRRIVLVLEPADRSWKILDERFLD